MMKTFCPECGYRVPIDEDGLCLACGATATGKAVDEMEELYLAFFRCPKCGEKFDAYITDRTIMDCPYCEILMDRISEEEWNDEDN